MSRQCYCDKCIECRVHRLELVVFQGHEVPSTEEIQAAVSEVAVKDEPLPDTTLETHGESGAGSGS